MHRLRPFPDELLAGILGRLCAIHGCTGSINLMKGLRFVHRLPDSAPMMHVLAEHFESTPNEVAFGHTLLPIQRAISSHAGTKREEISVAIHLGSYKISANPQRYARSCIECTKADLDAGRTSYWRRIHNIHTIDWCLEHQIPLMQFSPAAFEMLPVDAIKLHISEPNTIPSAMASNAVLGRFSELLRRWLGRKNAFSRDALDKVIRVGCRQHGLGYWRWGVQPFVSDLAREVLPRDWLIGHWPEVANKTPGAFVIQLDGPTRCKEFTYPGPTYALILAILFESVDEIELRLNTVHDQVVRAFMQNGETYDWRTSLLESLFEKFGTFSSKK